MTPMQVTKLMKPLRDKVVLMLSRGLLASVDDSTDIQLLKVAVSDDTVLDEVEHIHPYGLSSHAPVDGGEVLIGCIGGNREDAIALAVGNSTYHIKDLAEGEVVIYSKFGQTILLKEDGSIIMTPADGKKLVFMAETEFEGNMTVTGKITASDDVISGSISGKSHKHSATSVIPTVGGVAGTNAGTTGTPI